MTRAKAKKRGGRRRGRRRQGTAGERELFDAMLREPSGAMALAIARVAESRGADFRFLLFVLRIADICEAHKADKTAPLLTRDAHTGEYGGILPSVLAHLLPSLPPVADEQVTLALDTFWQAQHGSYMPPAPGGLRSAP